MKRLRLLLAVFAAAALVPVTGCGDDDTSSNPTCDPACGPCQHCDTTGDTPVCVDSCAADLTCQDGVCVAPEETTCDPACGPCQMCDTSDATPVCTDVCGEGTSCQDGACVAPAVVACDPACGPCQMCDTSGTDPVCVDLCGDGLVCEQGTCVAPPVEDPCAGACASCERCDTAHGVPTCVDACGDGASCDATAGVCRPETGGTTFDHSSLPQLQGPFTADVAGGKAVTQACLSCHAQAGQEMLTSAHFQWLGNAPNMPGGASGVGKRNFVNNFCIATASNEQRCAQCHAGYGMVDNTFDFSDPGNIDCLACHSPNYAKAKTTGGGPDSTVDMVAAAQSVGKPTRGACGRCHFKAGGGDNVKLGDMGSSLGNPTGPDVDVHMGATTDPFTCASCHRASAHRIPGQGINIPVHEGRIGCVDCHGEAPHGSAQMNNHALDVACQTCHIPAFSRQLPTKMDWDWSTAGNRTRGTNGVETGTLPDGTTVTVYDAMKGDFVWAKSVRPAYAWYDGRVTRMTINDTFPAGVGDSMANPIRLGGPVATIADPAAKIYPFKVMTGRQPVDTTARFLIVPKLFGPGGFWPQIPDAASYSAQAVEDLWTAVLTLGAQIAGQIGATEAYTGRATGAKPWDWAYTEMYLGINHEVAPASQALGCSDCHMSNPDWDWTALGYACDPMTDPLTCGSRHID